MLVSGRAKDMRIKFTLMACMPLVALAAPVLAADKLASYPNYTTKQKASAIDAIAAKRDVWLEDDQWQAMETCMDGLVSKGPSDRDLDEAIGECFGQVVRDDQVF